MAKLIHLIKKKKKITLRTLTYLKQYNTPGLGSNSILKKDYLTN
jgi:hypothetical protein